MKDCWLKIKHQFWSTHSYFTAGIRRCYRQHPLVWIEISSRVRFSRAQNRSFDWHRFLNPAVKDGWWQLSRLHQLRCHHGCTEPRYSAALRIMESAATGTIGTWIVMFSLQELLILSKISRNQPYSSRGCSGDPVDIYLFLYLFFASCH